MIHLAVAAAAFEYEIVRGFGALLPPGEAWKGEPSPAGFRVDIDGDRTAVQSRLALVKDLDGAFFAEETLRSQLAWRRLGFSAELVATGGVSEVWSGAGLGNARVAFDIRFGRRDTHAIGLVGTLPVGGWTRGSSPDVAWWGTVPRATITTGGFSLFYAGSSGNWVWHIRFGVDPNFSYAGRLDLAAGVAWVQPIAPKWSIVSEAELFFWPDPLQLRVLARHEFDQHWTLDVGMAAPIPAIFRDPTIQVLTQFQHVW